MRFASFRLGALLLASCAIASAQSYYWSAFAGRPPQPGFADGAARAARFYYPFGITAEAGGTVFVSDISGDAIRIIASGGGTVGTLAGGVARGATDGTGPTARFAAPAGLAIANGALYVADSLNHSIRRISSSGVVTTFAGRLGARGSVDGSASTARFNSPLGLASDGENLYVADTGNNTIRKITRDGEVSTIAGMVGLTGATDGAATSARFNFPASVTRDNAGNLYVADTDNHTIRKITPEGVVSTVAGLAGVSGATNGTGAAARFVYPASVIAYASGSLLVSDANNDCIRLIGTTGAVSVYAGRLNVPGSQDGTRAVSRFYLPAGICFGVGGVFVADSRNYSIRKISSTEDDVSTYAGPGGNFGRDDGVGPSATFNYPNGVAVHSSGDIYVADTRGNTIRHITPDGKATTLVGGSEDEHVDGPAGTAKVNSPFGIAVSDDRTVYFCEQQRHTIRMLRPDGSVTTLAGLAGSPGSTNGPGSSARFGYPSGVALGKDGNLYIVDTVNCTIRKLVLSTNEVFTLAGASLIAGTADGTGTAARFNYPQGISTDKDGNIYVADTNSHTIRRVTAEGVVSTIAGRAGVSGAANGTGTNARFNFPYSVFATNGGELLVADYINQTIRRIANDTVSTIGGEPLGAGFYQGSGAAAWFYYPSSVAADSSGSIYVTEAGNNIVRKGEALAAPVITGQPRAGNVQVGSTVTLSVTATGGGLTYQWKLNGVNITGATSATYTITNASAVNAGTYTVVITNASGSVTSEAAVITLATASDAGRIVNLSILSAISTPGDNFTMGFVVGGSGTTGRKPLVIRAAGPSLGALGVPGTLNDPKLELFFGATATGSNDNWGGSPALTAAMKAVGAFDYTGPTSTDAAIATDFTSGNNSAKISANGTGTGAVIAEIYDATPADAVTATTPRLINVSVLKHLGSGLTAGFAIGGRSSKTILIRAIGPTLSVPPFGVPDVVADPQLTLFSGSTKIGENNDWGGSSALFATFTQVGAFPLSATSKDAVLVATLQPGAYTVQVSGVGGTTGVALIEIYEVP